MRVRIANATRFRMKVSISTPWRPVPAAGPPAPGLSMSGRGLQRREEREHFRPGERRLGDFCFVEAPWRELFVEGDEPSSLSDGRVEVGERGGLSVFVSA